MDHPASTDFKIGKTSLQETFHINLSFQATPENSDFALSYVAYWDTITIGSNERHVYKNKLLFAQN